MSAMMSITHLQPGYHVTVGPFAPNGTPHPHAGKTGVITRIKNSAAFIAVDRGIEPQGFIFVSLTCLKLDPSSRLFKTKIEWQHLRRFRPTLDENVLRSYSNSSCDVRDQRASIEAKLAARRAKLSHVNSKRAKLKGMASFGIWYCSALISFVILFNHPSLFTGVWIVLNIGLMILGGRLNRIAMTANGGLMPVRQPGIRHFILTSAKHQYLTAGTKFQYLCDRYEIRRGKRISMVSIGDMLIWAGRFGMLPLTFFLTWQFFHRS
ncbi:MAG: DUF5317 family protein [Candidatus Sulfotelmatobacter sp.]|jgi:hypothetical protein